jgi:glycosyltransferase involved in cell wall biosynthesis
MRIALVASPFICVPPRKYGGTELFIGQLAIGIKKLGLDVVVYCCGGSTVDAETRWLYEEPEWPIDNELYGSLKDINHTSWALRDCLEECDIVHLNNAPGLALSRLGGLRTVYTIHHPHTTSLSEYYSYYPNVQYVTISRFQQERETMPKTRTIHHGVDLSTYPLNQRKQEYVSFLGRIAPSKGTHIAIEIAQKAGIPLKIAGEVQPLYRDYYERMVKPHVDGKFIEFVGDVDLSGKNELLGNSMALLFPIQWDEPFGLVMIEAMCTGTPVLALPGGSVREVIKDGVSGFVCSSPEEIARRLEHLSLKPAAIRTYAQQYFSVERMARDYAALYAEMVGETEKARPVSDLGAPALIDMIDDDDSIAPRDAVA